MSDQLTGFNWHSPKLREVADEKGLYSDHRDVITVLANGKPSHNPSNLQLLRPLLPTLRYWAITTGANITVSCTSTGDGQLSVDAHLEEQQIEQLKQGLRKVLADISFGPTIDKADYMENLKEIIRPRLVETEGCYSCSQETVTWPLYVKIATVVLLAAMLFCIYWLRFR